MPKGNTSSGSANATSLTVSHTVAAGSNLLIALISLDDGETSTAVFNTSESMTLLRRDENAGAATTEIWYLINPTVTTANIVFSGFGKHQVIGGGVDFENGATAPDNATGSTPDAATSVTATVSGVTASDHVIDVFRKPGTAAT